MTYTPADITRIAALCERVWAKVPEARPKHPTSPLKCYLAHFDPGLHNGMTPCGESWYWTYDWPGGDLKQANSKVPEFIAIALIESACLHQCGPVEIYPPCSFRETYVVRLPATEPLTQTEATTLVEALLMAVRAKGKKEPIRE